MPDYECQEIDLLLIREVGHRSITSTHWEGLMFVSFQRSFFFNFCCYKDVSGSLLAFDFFSLF